jgi:hypothetical protein
MQMHCNEKAIHAESSVYDISFDKVKEIIDKEGTNFKWVERIDYEQLDLNTVLDRLIDKGII